VATFLRATLFAICCLLALVVGRSETLGAAPQEPASVPPVSLERIREKLEKTPAPRRLDLQLQLPVATFKTSVNQRVYVLSLEEQLRKEFALTLLQRQSQDWASRCCGFSFNQLTNRVEKALRDRRIRKIREQIARELAQLEAARKKEPTRAEVK
jgi:hypothetical protein